LIKNETISLQNGLYHYTIPPLPKESEIWYYNLPKKEQFWKTPSNKDFRWLNPDNNIKDVRRMTERERINYIEYWRNVWVNGMWMMVNGEPTYLTGAHIDHLVFNEFDGLKLRYLNSQRLRFYFRDLTNNDPLCDGRCWMKPRRAGITLEEITEAIRVALSDYSNHVIFQSDTQSKAISTLLKPTIETYIRRPSWMREEIYNHNSKKPIKSLQLTSATIREDDFPLGSIIEALPTVASAADGKYAVLYVEDEFSKNESADPYELFEINKRGVHPEKKTKTDCLSTSGDSKDAERATRAWHRLISNSNPLIRNQNGKTNSGLYKYFIDATDSLILLKEMPDIIDKFGFVDRERAEEWVWNEHKKYPVGSKEYIFSLYKLPMEEKHVLLSPNVSSGYFNRVRIAVRMEELRGLPFDNKPYIQGNLEEDSEGLVYFISDAERQKNAGENVFIEKGKWLIAVMPVITNNFTVTGHIYFPTRKVEFIGAYDPINYPKPLLKSSNISRAAITIHKKFDYYNDKDSAAFCEDEKAALYVGRPDSPHDANKEAIKACKFFGCPMMHERSVAHVYEDFEKNRMLAFLMQGEDGVYGISPNNRTAIKDGLAMLQARYRNPQSPEEKDQIARHPFEDSLSDLDAFDINDTTQFDIAMTEVYLELGLKQIQYSNTADNSNATMMDFLNKIIPQKRR
jgi:hypothetical protein